jgi:hypothetical protein
MTEHNHQPNEEYLVILIELRADMKHVREKIDSFEKSENRQWEKLDALGVQVGRQAKDIETVSGKLKDHTDNHWRWAGLMLGVPAAIVALIFIAKAIHH